MNREHKYRAWNSNNKEWVYFGLGDLAFTTPKDWLFVDIENASQYTGLKDKNDKEIYEEDMVKADGRIFRVIWFDKGACFRYSDGANLESPLNYDDVEVIGNKFEHPELLK